MPFFGRLFFQRADQPGRLPEFEIIRQQVVPHEHEDDGCRYTYCSKTPPDSFATQYFIAPWADKTNECIVLELVKLLPVVFTGAENALRAQSFQLCADTTLIEVVVFGQLLAAVGPLSPLAGANSRMTFAVSSCSDHRFGITSRT